MQLNVLYMYIMYDNKHTGLWTWKQDNLKIYVNAVNYGNRNYLTKYNWVRVTSRPLFVPERKTVYEYEHVCQWIQSIIND